MSRARYRHGRGDPRNLAALTVLQANGWCSWRRRLVSLRLSPMQPSLVEKFTGKLVNLSQIFHAFLQYIHYGYRISHARDHRRRPLRSVTLQPHGGCARGFGQLLALVQSELEANIPIPLMPAPLFPSLHDPRVAIAAYDASGADGFGGFVYRLSDPHQLVVLSVSWPREAHAALPTAAPAPEGAPRLSMPFAELFAGWVVGREGARVLGDISFVLAVGDCAPAVGAMVAASSSTAQMRVVTEQLHTGLLYQGCLVPRELNSDADIFSHPVDAAAHIERLAASGYVPTRVELPPASDAWAVLRRALARQPGAAELAWRPT